MTTTTDPAAIDLKLARTLVRVVQEGGRNKLSWQLTAEIVVSLIAAVEALRKRIAVDGLPCACRFHGFEGAVKQGAETGELVDPDAPIRECGPHKALRERVTELEGKIADMLGGEMKLSRRAEAAEARMVEFRDEAIKWREARDLTTGWRDQWEAERAHVVELAAALELFAATDIWSTAHGGSGFEWHGAGNPQQIAEAVLVATPT